MPQLETTPAAEPFLKGSAIYPCDVLCAACQKALYTLDLGENNVAFVVAPTPEKPLACASRLIVFTLRDRRTVVCSKACLLAWVAEQAEPLLMTTGHPVW